MIKNIIKKYNKIENRFLIVIDTRDYSEKSKNKLKNIFNLLSIKGYRKNNNNIFFLEYPFLVIDLYDHISLKGHCLGSMPLDENFMKNFKISLTIRDILSDEQGFIDLFNYMLNQMQKKKEH